MAYDFNLYSLHSDERVNLTDCWGASGSLERVHAVFLWRNHNMASQSDTIPMQETARIVGNDGITSHGKDQTTVATYPTASESTFNLNSSNHDGNNVVELETAEDSDQLIEQGWISTSREWWMVCCFALMAMMVAMDALILIPIIPVSRSSVIF